MNNRGYSYFLRITTEKFLNSTIGLLLLIAGLFWMLPVPFVNLQFGLLKFSFILFLANTLFRIPLQIYFWKAKNNFTWDSNDKKFRRFYKLLILTGLLSSLSMGLMTVGSIIEFGQQSLFTSMLLVISGAMILIGANNFAFTKATVYAYIAGIFLPVIIFMIFIQDTQNMAYWGLLLVFGGLSLNQVFSARKMILENIEMNFFYQSQADYYKAIVESVPGMVTIFSSQLEYEIINSRVTDFTGLTEKDIVGKKLGFTHATPVLERIVIEFQNSYLTYNQLKVKLKGTHEEKWFLIALHKIKTTGQVAVVSIDIDAQVLAEEKSLEQRAMVETSARMAAIGQLAAGIAHEINNPLAVITTKSEQVMRRLQGPENEKNYLDVSKIQATAFRIANIVKGLKSLSRDGENDPFIECAIDEILKDISILFDEKLRSHQIRFSKNVPENLKIDCRATQLSQVVLNLVSNSIDAICLLPEKWIQIDATVENEMVSIAVTDSGKGIANEVAAKLMTPFFTTKAAGVGTGLGLSISKRIVTDHGGTMTYDSKCNNTRFVLSIPQKQNKSRAA